VARYVLHGEIVAGLPGVEVRTGGTGNGAVTGRPGPTHPPGRWRPDRPQHRRGLLGSSTTSGAHPDVGADLRLNATARSAGREQEPVGRIRPPRVPFGPGRPLSTGRASNTSAASPAGSANIINYRLRSLLEAGGFRPLTHSLL